VTRRPVGNKPDRDPYGLGPIATHVGPIAAAVVLLVIAAATLGLLNGQIPFLKTSSNNTTGPPGPAITPAPPTVVLPEPAAFKGSIVYAKLGNIWIQTTDNVRQLTTSGNDSMPSFSPDGKWVYFIRIQEGTGLYSLNGARRAWYDLETPQVSRVLADGSAAPEVLFGGRLRIGNSTWFSWIRQPVVSPDGKTIALVSDAPASGQSAVVLQLYDIAKKKLTTPNLAQSSKLGHQDPAWRPDGQWILYVKNGRNGARGAPQIMRYIVATGKAVPLTGPGYLAPAWSPDGRYVAATSTDNFGTDVVILDLKGNEILRVTDDAHSFSPVWSPTGDSIAFLHLAGQIVDLDLARLDGTSGNWTVKETVPLTQVSGLDGASRPGWFVPASDLPAPTPVPSAATGGSAPAGSAPAGSDGGSGGSTAP
jgi:Tol biopolymer transport system component